MQSTRSGILQKLLVALWVLGMIFACSDSRTQLIEGTCLSNKDCDGGVCDGGMCYGLEKDSESTLEGVVNENPISTDTNESHFLEESPPTESLVPETTTEETPISNPFVFFTPPAPWSGRSVEIKVTDSLLWKDASLTASGPCGEITLEYVGLEENPQGVWTWTYQSGLLSGGALEFHFWANSGNTKVVSSELNVSGCPDCGTGHPIYGFMGWSAGANTCLSNKRGFSVELLRTEVEWALGWINDRIRDFYKPMIGECLVPITRISFGSPNAEDPQYTIPQDPSLCDGLGDDDFGWRCGQIALQLKQEVGWESRRFVIGNQPNHLQEGMFSVEHYLTCYRAAYLAIKQQWPEAIVMPAAIAPWFDDNPDPGAMFDCGGDTVCQGLDADWKRYAYTLYKRIEADPLAAADAYAIHTYGGRDGDRDPYDDGEFGFGAFETTIALIDLARSDSTAAVYITEFQHAADAIIRNYDDTWNGDSEGSGFIPRAYQRIHAFNTSNAFRVKSLCWFNYDLPWHDDFKLVNTEKHPRAKSDFSWTTSHNEYVAPNH